MDETYSNDPLPELPDFIAPGLFPDFVPDDLTARYAREIRRDLRRRHSRAARARHAIVRPFKAFASAELWISAITLFSLAVIACAAVGALVYATILWPKVGFALSAVLLSLFLVSLTLALRLGRTRTPLRRDPTQAPPD